MVPVSLPCETFARGRSTCHQLRIVRGTRQDESASAALEQPLLSRWSRDGACALRCAKMKVERNRPPPGIPNLVASMLGNSRLPGLTLIEQSERGSIDALLACHVVCGRTILPHRCTKLSGLRGSTLSSVLDSIWRCAVFTL
jgi:hypothetical protein